MHNFSLDYQKTISDLTIDHLLHCTNKLLRASDYKKSEKLHSESLHGNRMATDSGQDSNEHQTGMFTLAYVHTLHLLLSFLLPFSEG